jgi:DNA-binding GntR family transcriptional regulator
MEERKRLRRIVEKASNGNSDEERTQNHSDSNRAFDEEVVLLSGNRKLAQIYSGVKA